MIHVIKNKNFYSLLYNLGIILVIMFFIILQISNPLSSTIEEDLGGHMIIEHSVFFLLGYCIISSAKKVVKNIFCKYKISSQSLFNPHYLNIKKINKKINLKKIDISIYF